MLLILATGVTSGHLYEGPLQWPTGVKPFKSTTMNTNLQHRDDRFVSLHCIPVRLIFAITACDWWMCLNEYVPLLSCR